MELASVLPTFSCGRHRPLEEEQNPEIQHGDTRLVGNRWNRQRYTAKSFFCLSGQQQWLVVCVGVLGSLPLGRRLARMLASSAAQRSVQVPQRQAVEEGW